MRLTSPHVIESKTISVDNVRIVPAAGFWDSDKLYSQLFGIPRQTLATWRFYDKKAGRLEAEPGKPRYRRWGRSVKYWFEPGTYSVEQVRAILDQLPARKNSRSAERTAA